MSNLKVVIIPIELEDNVDNIISDELTSLSAETKQNLDNLRQVTAVTAAVKQRKIDQEKAIQTTLQNIETELLKAKTVGIPTQQMDELIRPAISTLSGFTTRMKTYLKSKGNPHIMIRDGNKYVLVPYNYGEEGAV